MTERTNCAAVADALAEAATGAAGPADRVLVLDHLAECDACRRELDELARVVDDVLLVAPAHEPPAGFESAVLARVNGLARKPRRPAARPWALAALAAVAVGLGGAGIVWTATSDERELAANYRDTLDIADGQYFSAAPLLNDAGTQVGHVFLYQGEPSWLFAVLGEAPAAGAYEVVVATADGSAAVATCEVAEGTSCGAGATIGGSIYQVREVRLVGPAATLTAEFGSPG